jgi:membrane-associated phospholipid phosphatase
MKTKIVLLFLFFFGIGTQIFSQVTPNDTTKKDTTKLGKIVKEIIKDTTPRKETKKDTLIEKKLEKHFYGIRQFGYETYLWARTPLHWRTTDWERFGITVAGTAAFMAFDEPLNKLSQGNQRFYYSVPVVGGRVYGEWYFIGAITAGFGGYGILAHDTGAKKIAIELFQAGVYAEAVTEVLKFGTGRARPLQNEGAFVFKPFNIHDLYESFPSGHATSAFALSTVMFRHAHTTFWKIMAFVPAGFTVFSRFYQDWHWPSDLFFGSATGFATGMWVVTLHEKKLHKINIPADNK